MLRAWLLRGAWRALGSPASFGAALAVAVAGCQPTPGLDVSASAEDRAIVSAAAERRARLARSHESQGALARALVQWRAVAALDPASPEAASAVQRLSAQIHAGVEARYALAVDARARGSHGTARTEALRALALDPSHAGARTLLRELEHARALSRRARGPTVVAAPGAARETPAKAATTASEYAPDKVAARTAAARPVESSRAASPVSAAPASKSPVRTELPPDEPRPAPAPEAPSDADRAAAHEALVAGRAARALGNLNEAMRHFEKAVETANGPEAAAALAETRKSLADRYYEQGERAFRSDIGLAVESFEKAVQYDPQHPRARLRLEVARKARDRLARIK